MQLLNLNLSYTEIILIELLIVLATTLGTILGLFIVEYIKDRRRDYVYKKYFLQPNRVRENKRR